MAQCTTFQQMHEWARARELELESQGKRKREEHPQNHVYKKFRTLVVKEDGRKKHRKCSKCGRNHPGKCWVGLGICYKYGKLGHICRDCKAPVKQFFRVTSRVTSLMSARLQQNLLGYRDRCRSRRLRPFGC
ncbi:hypothetical protein OSB04_024469 [Centaurea solstitialis]|uniref:CCHC-type domain-containing protein n=1 Tax=Centaurea solstitialis TaxID=347529 RepID=A0AA38W0N6_9ASTR|nr:hypothetical protein OSB04_024469 [Centaurea solstitialis]